MKKLHYTIGGAFLAAASLHGQVVINEILGDTTGADAEFIELYNPGGSAVDISGWVIDIIESDDIGTFGNIDQTFTIPALSSIPSGGYFLIGGDDGDPGDTDSFVDVYTSVTPDATFGTSFLENSSYTLILRDDLAAVQYVVFMSDGDAADSANDQGLPVAADISFVSQGAFNAPGMYLAPDGSATAVMQSGVRFDQLTEPMEIHTPTPGTANSVLLGALTLTIPASALESAGSVAGTLDRGAVTSGDLVVSITTDDLSAAFVDGVTVIIPDGSSSVPITVTLIDDFLVDGTQTTTLTAVAGGHTAGVASIDVLDDASEAAPVVINEVYYAVDPTNGDANGDGTADLSNPNADEFIEIVNVSLVQQDLSGWILEDDDGDTIHEFYLGTLLDPGCAILVFGDDGIEEGIVDGRFGDAEVQISSEGGLFLSDFGDEVVLLDDSVTPVTIASVLLPDQSANTVAGSYNLSPEDDATSSYVLHSTLSAGDPFSPGTLEDGTARCDLVSPGDALTIVISPTTVTEGTVSGAATATVTLPAPAPTGGVCVRLVSDDSEAQPEFVDVFIFDGDTDAIFDIDTFDDTEQDGTVTVTLTASSSGYLNVSGALMIDDDGDVPAVGADLFISEYFEGDGGTNKYLEIFNPTSSAISLSGYQIGRVFNAPAVIGEPEDVFGFAPGAMVPAGGVYIIANSTSNTTIEDLAVAPTGEQTTSISFNGDDGYALLKGSSTVYTVIDRVGDWQGDPGSAWDVAGVTNATANRTLIRKPAIAEGNTDWDASRGTNTADSEWIVSAGANDVSDIGMHTFAGVSASALEITDITKSGMSATITFTSSGDVDVYKTTDLENFGTVYAEDESGPTYTDTAATGTEAYYILVPADAPAP